MKVKSVWPPPPTRGWIFPGLLDVIIWPDGESRLVLAELTYILSESSTRKENVLSPGCHKSRSCWLTGRCLTSRVDWNLSKLAFYKILCKPSKTRWNLPFWEGFYFTYFKISHKALCYTVSQVTLMSWIKIPLPRWNGEIWSVGLLKK